jgi:hypothetical protein
MSVLISLITLFCAQVSSKAGGFDKIIEIITTVVRDVPLFCVFEPDAVIVTG